MAASLAVQASDVSVDRGANPVLKQLNFTIETGQIVGLMGPSGCGKTTLMRAMVGVQTIKSGSLQLLSQEAGSKSLRKLIGYVTQSPSVYEDISIEKNLRYFAGILGAPKDQIASLLHDVQLTEYKDRIVSNLSGGQRARLSLAIALLGSPKLLVLDEPTVGLDPILRRDLWGMFRSYTQAGVTLIVSSHVMDEAERCDQVLLLREGRLLASGSKASILKQAGGAQTIEKAFISLVEQGLRK